MNLMNYAKINYMKSQLKRTVNKDIIDSILTVLPLNRTTAVYIFGSFGTDEQHEDSDIDIAWFCPDATIEDRTVLEDKLKEVLDMEVDLNPINKYASVWIQIETMRGLCIYCTEQHIKDRNNLFYNEYNYAKFIDYTHS